MSIDPQPRLKIRVNGEQRLRPRTAKRQRGSLAAAPVVDRHNPFRHVVEHGEGRVTGVRATDPSDASMPFGDGSGMGYSDRVLELTGLTDRCVSLLGVSAAVALGTVAVLIKRELWLVLVGGVFVAEALSVIVQVLFFRWTRRRVQAPLAVHRARPRR